MGLIPSALKRRAWRYLTRRMNLRWKLLSGLWIEVKDYADWCTYNEIFANREYEGALRCLQESAAANQPFRVLDLGANTGFFALWAMDRWLWEGGAATFEYIGVEASPETARDLAGRLEQGTQRGLSVQVITGLVGQREGMGQLRMGRESNLNSAQQPVHGKDEAWLVTRGVVPVPWIDLNQAVERWDRLDLIKCDIEGSEFAFIATYPELLGRAKWLVVEFHHAFGSVEEASLALQKVGFETFESLREADDVRVILFRNRVLGPRA